MKAWLCLLPALLCAQAPVVSGDAEISGLVGGQPLVIRTTSRLAGAIDSVKWDGVEFIDSHDHGRQLQSALNADVDGVFHVECYNPTEAGSVVDALGPKSTSRLEFLSVKDGLLSTRTRMAFWLAPGMKSHGQLAQNTALLSEHVLAKQVRAQLDKAKRVREERIPDKQLFVPLVDQRELRARLVSLRVGNGHRRAIRDPVARGHRGFVGCPS